MGRTNHESINVRSQVVRLPRLDTNKIGDQLNGTYYLKSIPLNDGVFQGSIEVVRYITFNEIPLYIGVKNTNIVRLVQTNEIRICNIPLSFAVHLHGLKLSQLENIQCEMHIDNLVFQGIPDIETEEMDEEDENDTGAALHFEKWYDPETNEPRQIYISPHYLDRMSDNIYFSIYEY